MFLTRLAVVSFAVLIAAHAQDTLRFSGKLILQPPEVGKEFSRSPEVTITVIAPGNEAIGPYIGPAEEGADYRFIANIDATIVARKLLLRVKVEEVDQYVQPGYTSRVSASSLHDFRVPYIRRDQLSSLNFDQGNKLVNKPGGGTSELRAALSYYTAAIEWNQLDIQPYLAKAQVLRRLSQPDEETTVYENMVQQIDPSSLPSATQYELYKSWGDAEFRKGTQEGWLSAAEQYSAALEISGIERSKQLTSIQGWFDSLLKYGQYREDRTFAEKVVTSGDLRKRWSTFYAAFSGKSLQDLPEPSAEGGSLQISEVKRALGRNP